MKDWPSPPQNFERPSSQPASGHAVFQASYCRLQNPEHPSATADAGLPIGDLDSGSPQKRPAVEPWLGSELKTGAQAWDLWRVRK